MASQQPVKIDEQELENAQKLWENFGTASKWCTIFIVIALIVLAFVTL